MAFAVRVLAPDADFPASTAKELHEAQRRRTKKLRSNSRARVAFFGNPDRLHGRGRWPTACRRAGE